jgi:uncharacterized protein YaiI (UPF0178 family)
LQQGNAQQRFRIDPAVKKAEPFARRLDPGADSPDPCQPMTSTTLTELPPVEILVDADACPVKPEIYKVAARHRIKVFVVSNSFLNVPTDPLIERVVVSTGFDAADDWIAERARRGSIVITADIPLASRAIKAGAEVIGPTGRPFTESSIGMALATRSLMEDLRAMGDITGGPKPFSAKDRSAFLSALDVAINRLKRSGFGATSP